MIKQIAIFFLLNVPILGYSQIDGFEFHREDLNKFREIISTQINYYENGDSTMSIGIHTLNNLGDVVKVEYFSNDSLDLWVRYKYDDFGHEILEEIHSEIYRYDEKSDKHVAVWDSGYFNGSVYLYSNDHLLIERRGFTTVEGNRSVDIIKKYFYNKDQELIKTETKDLTTGFQGTFKPNSATIDSIFYKDSESLNKSILNYDDKVITEKRLNGSGEIAGFIITRLNSKELPYLIIEEDSHHNQILQYEMRYDENNNLVKRMRTIFDMSKITYDLTIEDKYVLKYNDQGLPIIGLTYSEDQLISKRTLEYK